MMAKRLTTHLLDNGQVDTSMQKRMILKFIRMSRVGINDLISYSTGKIWKAICFDLSNADATVLHQMVWLVLDMYYVRKRNKKTLKINFTEFLMRFGTSILQDGTSSRQELQWTVEYPVPPPPPLHTVLISLREAEGAKAGTMFKNGCQMLPLKALLEDTTVITASKVQVRWMLDRLDTIIVWCSTIFKPKMSRSMSVIKEKVMKR